MSNAQDYKTIEALGQAAPVRYDSTVRKLVLYITPTHKYAYVPSPPPGYFMSLRSSHEQ